MTTRQDRIRRERALAHVAGTLSRVLVTASVIGSGAWLAWGVTHTPDRVAYADSQASAADAKAQDVASQVSDTEAAARASSRSKSAAMAGQTVADVESKLGSASDPSRVDVTAATAYGIPTDAPWASDKDGVTASFLTTTGFDGDSIPVAWSCAKDKDGTTLAYVTATWDVDAQTFSDVTVWKVAS